jgi:hypothetical protein
VFFDDDLECFFHHVGEYLIARSVGDKDKAGVTSLPGGMQLELLLIGLTPWDAGGASRREHPKGVRF